MAKVLAVSVLRVLFTMAEGLSSVQGSKSSMFFLDTEREIPHAPRCFIPGEGSVVVVGIAAE